MEQPIFVVKRSISDPYTKRFDTAGATQVALTKVSDAQPMVPDVSLDIAWVTPVALQDGTVEKATALLAALPTPLAFSEWKVAKDGRMFAKVIDPAWMPPATVLE